MFITFEGTEGSGKSTQVKLLVEFLESQGKQVAHTREPGWGKLGCKIRELVLYDRDANIEPFAELCLFCANRVQHVKEFIAPKLNDGFIVICDRYSDSTHIYQGYGRKLNIDFVKSMADESRLGVIPDLTLFLSLPPEVGIERLKKRDDTTKMDTEPLEFHINITKGYQQLISNERSRFEVIDANGTIDEIHKTIIDVISNRL